MNKYTPSSPELSSSTESIGQPVSSFDQRLEYRLSQAGIIDPTYINSDDLWHRQYERLLAMTGNTPITMHEDQNGTILLKRLSQGPSECHYDEVYLRTLKTLTDAGAIWPSYRNTEHNGQRVELVELTSGSAGISYGFVTKMLGFEATLLAPSELEKPRIHPMLAMGLNVVSTPAGYVKAASEELGVRIQELQDDGYKNVRFNRAGVRSIVLEKGNHRVCIVNHSANKITLEAFRRVGHEMADFLPAGVAPDYLVVIIGNFTSATSIAEIMKARYPQMKIIGLESTENPNWFEQRHPGRFEEMYQRRPVFIPTRIYGTSQRGVPLHFAKPDLFDEIRLFDPDMAINYQHNYNGQKSLTAETIGRSTAAALMISESITADDPGSIVFAPNYDKGDRYEKFYPASEYPDLFDPSAIQPIGYRQQRPNRPTDIPRDLREAYNQTI